MKLFPISPKSFFDFAEELIEKKKEFNCNEEVINRTIVDRLYYASFLHARTWIEQNISNHNLKYKSQDHRIVLEEINNYSIFHYTTKYNLNSKLNNLRKYRNDASYVLLEKYLDSDIIDCEVLSLCDDVDIFINDLPL